MGRRHAAFVSLTAATLLAGCSALPGGRKSDAPSGATAPSAPTVANRQEVQQCLAELGTSGARFGPLPDRYYSPGCQAVGAVRLETVRGDDGSFALANLGPVTCPLANTFAGWARYGVDRAARQILGSPLKRIVTMGSYSCRNVAGTARLSAHSKAEAIDVSGFELADGRVVDIESGWEGSRQEREFLRLIHSSACKRFGTVLGPDYNAAHRNHLHMELGSSKFCR